MVKPERASDSPKYKGVRKRKWGKWVSEIRLPNSRERIWLGSYGTPEKAARAFDAALFCLRGNTASFNFPQQPPDIPGGRSLPPSQIQAVAARFANHHSSCDSSSSTSSSLSSSSEEEERDETTRFLEDLTPMAMAMAMAMNNNSESESCRGVPDFGLYPGFDDDYLISIFTPPDYMEDYSHGIYLQGTGTGTGTGTGGQSFLWNF